MTTKRLKLIADYLIEKLDGSPGPAYDTSQLVQLVGAVGLAVENDDEFEMSMLGRFALAALVDHLRSSVNADRLIDKVAYQIGDHPG